MRFIIGFLAQPNPTSNDVKALSPLEKIKTCFKYKINNYYLYT